jgi:hypothetical protein
MIRVNKVFDFFVFLRQNKHVSSNQGSFQGYLLFIQRPER